MMRMIINGKEQSMIEVTITFSNGTVKDHIGMQEKYYKELKNNIEDKETPTFEIGGTIYFKQYIQSVQIK